MLELFAIVSLCLTLYYYYKYNHLTKTLIDKENNMTKELSLKSKELISIKKEFEKVDINFKKRKGEISKYLKEHEDVNCVLDLTEKISNLKENFEILSDLIYLQDFGLYDTDVDLRKYSKDSYIKEIKEKQKELLKADNYFEVIQGYTVEGNAKKGYKLQKDNAKVGIRCLNEESKAIIKGSTPSNRDNRIKRLEKSFEIINKNLHSLGIQILEDVLDIKKELLDIEIATYVKKEEEREKLKLLKEEERELKIIEKEKQLELEKNK